MPVYLVMLILAAYFLLLTTYLKKEPISDFGNYYFASKFLTEGKFTTSVYETYAFNLAVFNEGQRNVFLNYTPVPPLSALIYVPFVYTDVATAKWIWNCFTCLLFLFTLFRIHKKWRLHAWYLLAVPVVFFIPIRNNIAFGQSYFLVMFLLIEGFIAYQENRKIMASVCWAFCIHLKIFPAILLLFLLFQKDAKTILYMVLCMLAFFLLSMLVIEPEVWRHYLTEVLPRISKGEINDTYSQTYQSMQVLLKTLFVPDAMHNPQAIYNHPSWYVMGNRLFTALVLVFTISATVTCKDVLSRFALCLTAGMLISGYGTSYSLLQLMIPLIAILVRYEHRPHLIILFGLLVFGICMTPLYTFATLPILLQFPRMYLLILFFVLFVAKMGISFHWWSLVPIVFLLIPIQHEADDQSTYLLQREEALLIYDYEVKKDSILLSYFTMDGPQVKTVFAKMMADPIVLKEENNKKILPMENRMNTMYLQDSTEIYLSDKNRGVGFYTLRVRNQKLPY